MSETSSKDSKILLPRRDFLKAVLSTSGALYLTHTDLLVNQAQAGSPTQGACASGHQSCKPTAPNIEGPFFCDHAPWRTTIAGQKEPGTRLRIIGKVLQPDCKTPIPGAILELWHADARGEYDNSCQTNSRRPTHRLRARLRADAMGRYAFDTILPGRYKNGPRYRPAHIHYKVHAKGYTSLTTQLYFAGDPFLKGDPFVENSLIIQLSKKKKSRQLGVFDIILRRSR